LDLYKKHTQVRVWYTNFLLHSVDHTPPPPDPIPTERGALDVNSSNSSVLLSWMSIHGNVFVCEGGLNYRGIFVPRSRSRLHREHTLLRVWYTNFLLHSVDHTPPPPIAAGCVSLTLFLLSSHSDDHNNYYFYCLKWYGYDENLHSTELVCGLVLGNTLLSSSSGRHHPYILFRHPTRSHSHQPLFATLIY